MNLDWSPRHYFLAEARVVDKIEQNTFDIRPNCTRSSRPVLSPPNSGSFDFATSASLYDIAKRHG